MPTRSLAEAVAEIVNARRDYEAAQRRLITSIGVVADLMTEWEEDGRVSLTFLDAFEGEAKTIHEQIEVDDSRLIGDVTTQEIDDLLKLGELALDSVTNGEEVTA